MDALGMLRHGHTRPPITRSKAAGPLWGDSVEEVRSCPRWGELIQSGRGIGVGLMMGEHRVRQDALFYEFSLEQHVPVTHLLRAIDRFVELDGLRQELA